MNADSTPSLTRTLALALLACALASARSFAAPSFISLLDARERGVFTMGSSKGDLRKEYSPAVKRDVLRFEYSAPPGTAAGVWTKSFPARLGPRTAGSFRLGVRVPKASQLRDAAVLLEIKGTRVTQSVPLLLKPGWNYFRETIEWEKIGSLKEVVLVVSPVGGGETARGGLDYYLDFVKESRPGNGDSADAASSTFSILGAGQRGVFNMGASKGSLRRLFDGTIHREVFGLDYSVPPGTAVGIWTKKFPPELGAGTANAVEVGVRVLDPAQVPRISATLEIKGTRVTQSVPVALRSGWVSFQEIVNWDVIGDLNEVVLVVSPAGKASSDGSINLYADFIRLTTLPRPAPALEQPPLQKKGSLTRAKIGLVFLAGILLGMMGALLNKFFGRGGASASIVSPEVPASPSSLTRDFLYGTVAVMVAGVALGVYILGGTPASDHNFRFLIFGVAGAAIAELLKFGLTGRHLTSLEIFQDVFFIGVLAATSGDQGLLHAPLTWEEVLVTHRLTSALACLIYLLANASSLAARGRHLRLSSGALIAGTPYLFGWLLILENADLLQILANSMSGGTFAAWPAIQEGLGRLIVMFGFNEAAVNGICLATRGEPLKSTKSHLMVFFVSLAVTASPSIADLGSTARVAMLPDPLRAAGAVLAAMFSQAGLWAEVYLMTGAILDGTQGLAPSWGNISGHASTGARKGMAYSGTLLAILYALDLVLRSPLSRTLMPGAPAVLGAAAGALLFPLVKTIIETFDGSQVFFERVRYSYRNIVLYARGAVAGWGLAYAISNGLFGWGTGDRILFGLGVGLAAASGVSLVRDAAYAALRRGRVHSWRVYAVDSLLGGFVGSAVAFYLDMAQVPVIVEKFRLYISAGFPSQGFTTYPLVSKWGRIDLGGYTGGVKLLYNEALSGVINWSVAAWLFAVNRAFVEAYFQKDKAPIRFLFSKAGMVDLVRHMIQVLRWGLWMSPIINTFLRMMGHATWYNQDGLVRTLIAVYHNFTLSPAEFQAWSLKVFIGLLAVDLIRVLVWIDHMGLRVATLVNLSFIGMNKFDDRIARFIGKSSSQRTIPEGVKRFTTWAPLLIPFYIPRGENWDIAWSAAESIQNAGSGGGWPAALSALPVERCWVIAGAAVLACTAVSSAWRALRRRKESGRAKTFEISNRGYRVVLKDSGAAHSEILPRRHDLSRRSYDTLDPGGRALFIVDASRTPESAGRSWPVLGNFSRRRFAPSRFEGHGEILRVSNDANGIRTTIEIALPDHDAAAEVWTVTLENTAGESRQVRVVPYLEWVLDRPDADRGHTQYARLFPEMEYASQANAVLAWQRNTKCMGFLASGEPPEGYLISRMDFIGRARSIWSPRALETLDFCEPRDASPCPTFDPAASLNVGVALEPGASRTVRFLLGCAKDRAAALNLVERHLRPEAVQIPPSPGAKKRSPLIGHGEVPPGTPQPYFQYREGGRKLLVRTPFTPRPFDHALSNSLGHYVSVTNRGLHTTANGNSQQNRFTPDWADTVTREVPGEAIYLHDPESGEWFSPAHQPLNDLLARNEAEFGVDGTAVFRMERGNISTELTVFVPPDETLGVYLLTVRNGSDRARRLRVAPYFQIVLAGQPEWSGPLRVGRDKALDALLFENPRNTFRSGPVFASMSIAADALETSRGRFFGPDGDAARPEMVESGAPAAGADSDRRPVAALLGTLEVPARGESTVAVILGQADGHKEAARMIRKYKDVAAAAASLEGTRAWWLRLMGTLEVRTNHPEFDGYQNWLKYQALAERIWARRGFYQTSGAYGFRDQLQDSVNLIWVDPGIARRQILLHASQQFIEGDVVHWFHTLHDGRTAFANRSHASDNLLWLAWAAGDYVRATGDETILDEMTSYLESENPFQPLPKNKHGWGDIYHRSAREDTVYRHCMKSIDLVLEKRMGRNGIPLIGTGDWNDGLDEIGSEGRGESVWLGFFLHVILKNFIGIIAKKDGPARESRYRRKLADLEKAIESTWRGDRYLRAVHDDGTEIGVKGSGIWEIDALTASWAVMAGVNFERAETVFRTALDVLEKDNVILLGWPALREDTTPYLGRSSHYPEGVRENGMYCHGVQWLVRAARLLSERFEKGGDKKKAQDYRDAAWRLWLKISPIPHSAPEEIELYGGQPNKQAADLLTTYDPGRMIWNGYTGAAGWMLRQAMESVVGAALEGGRVVLPSDLSRPRGGLMVRELKRKPPEP
ncbi:MAG: hypothetical protein A2636_02480 [Elusimicrobia bacterium RIFCSPHIGHO2_01_FULL_64_10]|nr:MAG: hypothetical protein A2636_02480 [Elusimicrobia bacterium RIFCSPHIGHO2_01_FULL_64_10]